MSTLDDHHDWIARSRYVENLEVEICFSLRDDFYTGDPNNSEQIRNRSLYEALVLPDFPRAKKTRASTLEVIGNEAALATYYKSIVEKAYALGKDFWEISQDFWLGLELRDTSEKEVNIGFPWYDTLAEIQDFTRWLAKPEAPFSDEDQGWQVDALVADGFLHIRCIDPDSDIEWDDSIQRSDPDNAVEYDNIKTPWLLAQVSASAAEGRAEHIVAALTRAMGVDAWTKSRYPDLAEEALFGTPDWLPRIRAPKPCRLWQALNRLPIVRAQASDMEELLKLQYAAYQSEALIHGDFTIQPLTQTRDDLIEEYEKGVFLKMTMNGIMVGSVRAREENGTVYIGKLMVHPSYQGNGLGKRLLMAIERKFPNRRYELFTSAKSARNLHFYEAAGYTRLREETDAAGIGFVYLEKQRKTRAGRVVSSVSSILSPFRKKAP